MKKREENHFTLVENQKTTLQVWKKHSTLYIELKLRFFIRSRGYYEKRIFEIRTC